MTDMFPTFSKFSTWQSVDKEQGHMSHLSHKEKIAQARNNLRLYRNQVELSEDSVKCAGLVQYLDFQKLLNIKIAISTMAETSMLERRLYIAKEALQHIKLFMELMTELVEKFDKLYIRFLRDAARLMNLEKPKDIVDRHTTLTMIKKESLGEYNQIHAKLHKLKEKDANVKDERLKKSLVLYNRKREFFQQWQELTERNMQLSADVKIWEANSNTTQRVLIQSICHIQQMYKRQLETRRYPDYSKPKTNVMDMLDEISKDIMRKTVTLKTISVPKSSN